MLGASRELLNTAMVRTLMCTRQTVQMINSGLFLPLPFFALLPPVSCCAVHSVPDLQQISWVVGFPVSRRGRQREAEPQKKGSCWSTPRAGGFPHSTSAWLAFCTPSPQGVPITGRGSQGTHSNLPELEMERERLRVLSIALSPGDEHTPAAPCRALGGDPHLSSAGPPAPTHSNAHPW